MSLILDAPMPVIASTSRRPYLAAMPTIILRVVTLLALVLMPLGMALLTAAPHHGAQASAPGHCDDNGGKVPDGTGGEIDCTVTCAAVAPAELGRAPATRGPALALWAGAPAETAGLNPEAIPPPPKRI